jgi:uncharacterized protein (DUF697 family)
MTIEENRLNNQNTSVVDVNEAHHEQSIKLIRNYTIGSLAPAILPIPLLDLTILSSIQLKLLYDLSNLYDVEFSTEIAKASIASLVSSILPVATAPLLASLVKFIPGIGQVSSAASMLVLGGASTYALGMIFKQHFESGGNFSDFNVQVATEYFKEEFENGKKVVAEIKQKSKDKFSAIKG